MLEGLLTRIGSLGHLGYLLIFLFPFLESSAFLGLLVPGETVVVLAGFLAAHGYLELGDCILVIALGAILGDSTGYALGRALGKEYFQRHERLLLFKRTHLNKVEAYFAQHGGKTIFWGRLIHLLRAMAPFTAGMSNMSYQRFLFFNALGGILWATAFTLVGYFFGQSWQLIDKWVGRAGVFILFLFLVIGGFGLLYKKLDRDKESLVQWFQAIPTAPLIIRFRQRYPMLVGFIEQRLSPRSYLGLHLTVGLSLCAVFVWIFGGITEDILHGDPFVLVDQWVVGRVIYFRSPLATSMMEAVTQLGGMKFIAVSSLALLAYLLLKRHIDQSVGFGTAVLGGFLLNLILKTIIHRPRPISETTLMAVNGWSFPSGHAMSSVIFYGMLTYLVFLSNASWRMKVLCLAFVCFLVFMIGFSRLYLQVHYLSDVLAGFISGLFWLSICITGLEMYLVKNKEP